MLDFSFQSLKSNQSQKLEMAIKPAFLLFSALFIITTQISIPLTQNANRCMIVYTSSPDQNLILDMKFPQLINQQSSQYYRIAIYNTEDKTSTQQNIKFGNYRKELDLIDSVVYKVCFAVMTNRSVGSVIVEYNAETRFGHHVETTKVPENLLKSQDFKATYTHAQNIKSLAQNTLSFQKQKRQRQDEIYLQNKNTIDTLFWISLFEIGVICLTGIYQFFSVRSFLMTKQYL